MQQMVSHVLVKWLKYVISIRFFAPESHGLMDFQMVNISELVSKSVLIQKLCLFRQKSLFLLHCRKMFLVLESAIAVTCVSQITEL